MLYIVCALYEEAKSIIEKYNLKNINNKNFRIYEGDEIRLIISGIGKINSAIATTYFLNTFNFMDTDIILNIGYAGTNNTKYNIGDQFLINNIFDTATNKNSYLDMIYKINMKEESVATVDKILNQNINSNYKLFDMEASAFYSACNKFIKRDNIFVVKIISDYIFDKDKKIDTNTLSCKIYDCIESFIEISKLKYNSNEIFTKEENDFINNIIKNFKLSKTLELEFKNLAHYLKLCNKNIFEIFENCDKVLVKEKKEGKTFINELKRKYL